MAAGSIWRRDGVGRVLVFDDDHDLIASAVFAGHTAAREFGTVVDPDVTPFRQERPGAS